MIKFQSQIKKCLRRSLEWFRLMAESCIDAHRYYLSASWAGPTKKQWQKHTESDMIRRYHVLEKSLTISDYRPKAGFRYFPAILKPDYLEALPIFLILAVSYGSVLACGPFLPLAIARGEMGSRNLTVSFRFIYLGIAAIFGLTAFSVAIVQLAGSLTIRMINDLPLFLRICHNALHPKNNPEKS